MLAIVSAPSGQPPGLASVGQPPGLTSNIGRLGPAEVTSRVVARRTPALTASFRDSDPTPTPSQLRHHQPRRPRQIRALRPGPRGDGGRGPKVTEGAVPHLDGPSA